MVSTLAYARLFAAQDSPCLSAGYQHLLHAFYRSHVLSAFEGSRIGAADLAHAALHLANRLIFVIFHPLSNTVFDMTQMADSVAQQSGAQHGDIGAAQEQAALLLQDQSILREAETRSQDVLDRAQAKAEETMHGADQYAADVLVRLESDLVKTLSVIKKSLEVLEERRAEPQGQESLVR